MGMPEVGGNNIAVIKKKHPYSKSDKGEKIFAFIPIAMHGYVGLK
jgi:hypothetical protein